MREPLTGWRRMPDGHGKACIGCVTLSAWTSGYWQTRGQWPDAKRSPAPDLRSAKFAADGTARAMVADMAEALGGSVTWGESGVGR